MYFLCRTRATMVGRKKNITKDFILTIRLEPSTIKALDVAANAVGLVRSELVRELVNAFVAGGDDSIRFWNESKHLARVRLIRNKIRRSAVR